MEELADAGRVPASARGLVVGLVLGLVLVLALVATVVWWWGGRPAPTPWDTVTIDGQSVLVDYSGSPCEDSARLEIEETADEVVVTVRAGSHALSCADVAVSRRLSGRLREPVGVRVVVDGACRQAETSAYLACAEK